MLIAKLVKAKIAGLHFLVAISIFLFLAHWIKLGGKEKKRIKLTFWLTFLLRNLICLVYRVRTSSGMFLKRGQDRIIRGIEKRIADFTFIPMGEYLKF